MSAIDRMYKYFELKGITAAQFEKRAGFTEVYFSKRKGKQGGLSERSLKKIIDACPEMNHTWLVSGVGKATKALQDEASGNLVIQENLRLKKELKQAEGAIDIFLKRERVFGGSIEEIKQKYSEVVGRLQAVEDEVFPDNEP